MRGVGGVDGRDLVDGLAQRLARARCRRERLQIRRDLTHDERCIEQQEDDRVHGSDGARVAGRRDQVGAREERQRVGRVSHKEERAKHTRCRERLERALPTCALQMALVDVREPLLRTKRLDDGQVVERLSRQTRRMRQMRRGILLRICNEPRPDDADDSERGQQRHELARKPGQLDERHDVARDKVRERRDEDAHLFARAVLDGEQVGRQPRAHLARLERVEEGHVLSQHRGEVALAHLAHQALAEVGPARGVRPDEEEVDGGDDGDLAYLVVDRGEEGVLVGRHRRRAARGAVESVDELAEQDTDERQWHAGADGCDDANDEQRNVGAIGRLVQGKVVGRETDALEGISTTPLESGFLSFSFSLSCLFTPSSSGPLGWSCGGEREAASVAARDARD